MSEAGGVTSPSATRPDGASSVAGPPAFLQLEPVGQCNLRCTMCPIAYREDGPPHGPPALLPWSLFTRLVDSSPALRELHLQGLGEPLMHPRFFDMVSYATARGIDVSTNSNLTLLDAKRAERCLASGLAALHVSIDAVTPTLYEQIRVGARFERVVENLERLQRRKRERGLERPDVRIVMVLMRGNLDEIAGLVRLASRVGVGSVHVQRLCHDFGEETLPARYAPMRRFVANEDLANEPLARIDAAYEAARTEAARCGIDLRLPRIPHDGDTPTRPRRERGCDWPWQGPYVAYDGRVMPCCMIATPDRATLGDASREQLPSLWNGDAYTDFRRRLLGGPPPAVCAACSIYKGTF